MPSSAFLNDAAVGDSGEAYNIGNTNNEISMYDLGKMYASLIPGATVNRIPYPSTYPAGEPQRRCPDLTKAKKHLGYASTGRLASWPCHIRRLGASARWLSRLTPIRYCIGRFPFETAIE